MDKLYAQQYGQLEKDHWWFAIRQKIILQSLRRFVPGNQKGILKILNAGAAAGGSSKWLSALGEVVSLENDPLFLSHLYGQDLAVVNATVTAMPLKDNSFDLVCAFDLIEHVDDDHKAFGEMFRICKPGGSICITVPAIQSLWGNHDVVNGHKRRYTKKQLQDIAHTQAVITRYSSYFNSLLFIPVFLFRKFQTVFKSDGKKHQSDFAFLKTNIFVNKLLKKIFGIEPFLLRSTSFPIGVSLIMIFQKATPAEPHPQ